MIPSLRCNGDYPPLASSFQPIRYRERKTAARSILPATDRRLCYPARTGGDPIWLVQHMGLWHDQIWPWALSTWVTGSLMTDDAWIGERIVTGPTWPRSIAPINYWNNEAETNPNIGVWLQRTIEVLPLLDATYDPVTPYGTLVRGWLIWWFGLANGSVEFRLEIPNSFPSDPYELFESDLELSPIPGYSSDWSGSTFHVQFEG